ncbi:MAG TPA: TIGR00159 family protein [Papillibacter sp.]|jgi:diadenylate cyclase|nr:TIGR00159 family protein [Papillibacter sp.]
MDATREVIRSMLNVLNMISLWDVLDILIIAYLIYRVISVLRKTNAASVIKGIMLVLAVMWLSSLLHLNVINYLLGQTMKLGLLVFIILFQPEIRRLLEQVGSSKLGFLFGRKVPDTRINQCINAVVSACTEMAKKRIGVLIVFERDIRLDDTIQTGTRVDAEVSYELLTNIFYPNTPLHDGAVIIRNGRIVAASCMLPLTTKTNLSRDLGMRHRASIGVSEITDAVAVTVSEETGSISVAIGGMLKRHLSQETFEKLLRLELGPDEKSRRAVLQRK